MNILNRRDKILTYYSCIFPLIAIIILAIALIIANTILGCVSLVILFSGLELFFILQAYINLKIKKHPYIEDPEEIQNLKDTLEEDNLTNTIKNLFFKHKRKVKEIAWMLEKNLNIELHIPKRFQAGEIKSEELYQKKDSILNTNTEKFWKSHPYYVNPFFDKLGSIIINFILIFFIIFFIIMLIYGCPLRL